MRFEQRWLELLGALESRLPDGLELSGITHDTRELRGGEVFVGLAGRNFDGGAFLATAAKAGAALLVSEDRRALEGFDAWIHVRDARTALAVLADLLNGSPSKDLILVGVTGTNGKTSTTYLLEAIAKQAGLKPGVIGTVDYRFCGQSIPASHTTPEAPVLQQILARMRQAGCDCVFMEVSSHSIAMKRVHGCHFAACGASNLSQDHLDFHGTLEEYGNTKALLFSTLLPSNPNAKGACINLDDPWAASLRTRTPSRVFTYSLLDSAADIHLLDSSRSDRGTLATFSTPKGPIRVDSRLVGTHNLYNIAHALSLALMIGIAPDAIAAGIASLKRIPGRLEPVENSLGINIWVDYGHTPEAVRNVCRTAREQTRRELLCVFGAGGDRDSGKRPLMAAAAAQFCRRLFVTSDNPRTEDPADIVAQVAAGVPAGVPLETHLLRPVAIKRAVEAAQPGDTVLIVGKGHEYYQEICGTRFHFDDRECAAAQARSIGTRGTRGATLFTLDEAATLCGGMLFGDGSVSVSRLSLDSRDCEPGTLFAGLKGSRVDGHDFAATALEHGASGLLLSRIPANLPASWNGVIVDDVQTALGTLAGAHRTTHSPIVVGLTGSCGKTTTRQMITHILQTEGRVLTNPRNYNNLLGLPQTLLLLNADHDFAVLELGTSQRGEISRLASLVSPDVALVTMVAEAHTEGLGDLAGVTEEKSSIFRHLNANGVAVVPSAYPTLVEKARATGRKVLTFGRQESDFVRIIEAGTGLNPKVVFGLGRQRATVSLPLSGAHNIDNAAAALCVVCSLGVSLRQAVERLGSVAAVSGRSELRRVEQAWVINDSYNANPGSMKAALELLATLPAPRVAVLGAMAELGALSEQAHEDLGRLAGSLDLDALYLVGEMAAAARGANAAGIDKDRIHLCGDQASCAERLRPWLAQEAYIVIKGSRSSEMEKVLGALGKEAAR